MKYVCLFAMVALSACQMALPQNPEGSVVIANEEFGFTVAIPNQVLNEPSQTIPGGQGFSSDLAGIRMAVWGEAFPAQGIEQLASEDRGRIASAGNIITFQETDSDGYAFWAASAGSQVFVQSTEVGVDCDDSPIIASYLYTFDKNRTPGELRYLTSDENFPRFNFASNCP